MPTLREEIDRNVVSTSRGTTVRALLELVRRKPSRIYTWVVVPMPQGRWAVTRLNEIAAAAEEWGADILDMALDNVSSLLRQGGSVQSSTPLDRAEEVALANPGERIPVLEGEEMLGVLNLGPRQPPLPALDPWKLEGGAPYRWPYYDLQLSDNYVVLDPWTPVVELVQSLARSEEGWVYLVVPEGAATYRVLAVNTALADALDHWEVELRDLPVGELPLPRPLRAIEEGAVSWELAQERVLRAPARCLPVLRDGKVAGILAEPARRVPHVADWLNAFGGYPPWGEARELAFGGRELTEGTTAAGEKSIEEAGPPPRFFNAGFFPEDGVTPLLAGQALALDGGPCRLGVNVGKFWGPGEQPEKKFALDGILKKELEALEEGEALTLVVAVRPRAVGKNLVQVDQPRQELKMPREGDGPLVFFGLTFARVGRHALNVDLLYQGHLLQSLRVEAWVVQHAGDAVPAEHRAQDRRLTFSRAGTLSKESLAALEKRPSTLTILVDRDGQIDLWFYDVKGNTLGTQQPNLSDATLNTLLGRMREALQQVENSYTGQIGGDREKLRLSLWRLASTGNEFYRALLPRVFDPEAPGPAGQLLDLKLTPGQVIQVAPLSMLPGVPWELLYEREIERFRDDQPERVTLCDFEAHPPDACPHDDSRVVCPYSFWGYRYIIEQLPNWVAPDQPPPLADLPLLVRNHVPLRFVPFVYDWPNLESHLEALRALAKAENLEMQPAIEKLDDLEEELKDQLHPADILYFYAHGGFDAHEPVLELGPEGSEFKFTAGDLAAWKKDIDLSLHQPLVVFNACETAAYLPEHHESLPKGFADRGASGVIGTQVKVHTTLADHFIRIFFKKFLAKQTVGRLLFEARRALLSHTVEGPSGKECRPDPRGLVYSLFAAADVELAEPVITPE